MYFDKFAQKGNEFINQVAATLDIPNDRKRALRITKAVLHALRDRISPEESVQLLAQLPLYVKAIYVDGWRIGTNARKVRRLDDFYALVERQGAGAVPGDFFDQQEVAQGVEAVFRILRHHVSPGEIEDIRGTLPKELAAIF